ncbi:PD-(D/E)XK endonuclease [Haloplanus vescus]|uniref:PD-(D/E)XK endonuclease n=1 Tax=Haloplanus vescus TaxID=555874 RepID=A0A1H3X850_9EURY|nr:group I intron-associated PD-(D/E)XK endonuclease [Haloplanus vescus]SDZ95585.1 PD-(D/E)XK endonuclease [Haloplanus vescus]
MTDDATHPKERGERSEAAVLHEFLRRGCPVLRPFGDNQRYDLVVEVGASFYRIQVKTGRLENGRIQFETRSTGTRTRAIDKEGYEGQIEAFAVYAPATDHIYVVPISDAPSTSMALRVTDPDKLSPNINWADDFGVGEWISSRA